MQVGDVGVVAIAQAGVLVKLVARACPDLTDAGIKSFYGSECLL